MSKENVEKFYNELTTNTILAKELQENMQEINSTEEEKQLELVLKIAAKHGFCFSECDLMSFFATAHELSNEELDQINAAYKLPYTLTNKYKKEVYQKLKDTKIIANETNMDGLLRQ